MTDFLLVPGAGGDAWYWHRLVAELAARGHTVVAVEAAGDTDGLVVVGQSMGGFTAPLLCGRLPVRELVLLNAMIPRPGETADPWPLDAWPDVATRVIASTDDRFFPIEFQRHVAKDRLGIGPDTLPGGHLVALSRPIELADVLVA